MIFEISQNKHDEIRTYVFRIIVDIANYFYDFINEDIEDFAKITNMHVIFS